ncbi:hypothetical protein QP551_04400 [Slackia exigua]|uniref:hypothetical protein n=1 Tax=Slackia exigua TaxID=84109 RepID=UPI00254FF417|nr:hypothetical protein [Slackia exigua]MDK7723938.1 hypothetical protein [Slackia exigua]MDK7725169.1 hypothetical protein [Slackia exigua]
MSRILPEAPFFRKLLEKHGADYVFSTFFDKNLDPLPDAPKELKKEIGLLRSECGPRLRNLTE